MLQRLSEDLEYYELLDKAAKCHSSLEQMCYVAAFTVSSYSTTVHRTGKPFNPLLGETFELDRLRECSYRSLCEQVFSKAVCSALLTLLFLQTLAPYTGLRGFHCQLRKKCSNVFACVCVCACVHLSVDKTSQKSLDRS